MRTPSLILSLITCHPELAKEGIPLPFGNRFWASNWPTGKAPIPGLLIHLIPSVSHVAIYTTLLFRDES